MSGEAAARVRLRRLAPACLSIVLVAGLLAYTGPGEVARVLRGARPALVASGVACYALFFLVRGARWRLLLGPEAPGATVGSAAGLTAAGWLVSTYVPLKAGDLVRTVGMVRRGRAPLARVASTVAVERVLDVFGLATASSIALAVLWLTGAAGAVPAFGRAVAVAWLLPVAAVAALFVVARLAPRRPRSRVVRFAVAVVEGARALLRDPRRLPALAGLTLAAVGLQVLLFTSLFLALRPGAPGVVVAAGVPIFLLSFVVAVTPGHVGTYEAAFVAVYALLGMEAEPLLPLAVAVHLLTATTVLLLGGAALAALRWGREPAPSPAGEPEAPA